MTLKKGLCRRCLGKLWDAYPDSSERLWRKGYVWCKRLEEDECTVEVPLSAFDANSNKLVDMMYKPLRVIDIGRPPLACPWILEHVVSA